VYYLLALGDPNVSSFDTVNDELLDQADAEYEAALTFDAPESANIDEKVHFGLGQVYLVRAQIEAGEWTVRAKNEFNQVIAAYQSGDPRLTDLAGHAYARLGLIALLEGDADNAASNYEMASKLVTPYWQGIYKARIGEIYVDVGEIDLALRAFQEAVQIAEQFGDEESAERYLDRVREIEANTK
jgi:tetratricopeptide (TPR) repeat protein